MFDETQPQPSLERTAVTLFTKASAEYPACVFGGGCYVALALKNEKGISAQDLLEFTTQLNPVWETVAKAANTRHQQAGLSEELVNRIYPSDVKEMAESFFTAADWVKDVPTATLQEFLDSEYPQYKKEMAEIEATNQDYWVKKKTKSNVQYKFINKLRTLANLPPVRSAQEIADEEVPDYLRSSYN
jgi:hypothetical protein